MTVFADIRNVPEPFKSALAELEYFIGSLDSVCTIDDGTIDAEDAVRAFNVIVDALVPNVPHTCGET